MADHNTGPTQQLPDFKPRGMGKWDKIMMWIVIFIVLLFGLGEANKLLPDNTVAAPKPKVTVTATPHPTAKASTKAAPAVYVVENTANGYIWWLDPNGSPFTHATAEKFILGHYTYHVYTLKRS